MSKFATYKDPLEAKPTSKDKNVKKQSAKIRYVNCQNFMIDSKEKESHKILQQLEFSSLSEMVSAKGNQGSDPYYDDYYYQQ